jgi:hypothetical protein
VTPPFSIAAPETGATVSTETITVSGSGPAGEPIVRDIPMAPDDRATVGSDGRWSLIVRLDRGSNDLTFRLGDDKSTAITLTVTYAPEPTLAIAEPLVTAEPLATAEPTPAPTPTPKPTPLVVVSDEAVTVSSSSKSAFRGKVGTYNWSTVTIAPDRTIARWSGTAGASSCRVAWRVSDGADETVAGAVKVPAKTKQSALKTFDTSTISDAALEVVSSCPSWVMTMAAAPTPKPVADSASRRCDRNYSGYCVPVVSYDLDCRDIGHSVTVVGIDHHRFDADGDGLGCESYS